MPPRRYGQKRERAEDAAPSKAVVERAAQFVAAASTRLAKYQRNPDLFSLHDLLGVWSFLSENREAIAKYPQGTKEWKEFRDMLTVTGTRAGALIREAYARSDRDRALQPEMLIFEMLCPIPKEHAFMRYGTENEWRCRTMAELRINWMLHAEDPTWDAPLIRCVEPEGLQLLPDGQGHLGMSLDGLLRWPREDGLLALLECKCAAATKKLPEPHPFPPHYMAQVQFLQGLLETVMDEPCLFAYAAYYTPERSRLVTIPFNPVYFDKIMNALDEWMLDMLVPAALRFFNTGTFPSWVPDALFEEVARRISEENGVVDDRTVPEDSPAFVRWMDDLREADSPFILGPEDSPETVPRILGALKSANEQELALSWHVNSRKWTSFATVPCYMPEEVCAAIFNCPRYMTHDTLYPKTVPVDSVPRPAACVPA